MSTRLLGAFHLYEWWKREFVWPVFHSYIMILFEWPFTNCYNAMYWKTKYNVNFFYIHNNTQVFLHNLVENWINFLLMFRVIFCTLFSNLKTKSTCTFLHVTFVWCYIKSFNNTLLKGKACYVCVAKKPICIEHKKKVWSGFCFCCTIVT